MIEGLAGVVVAGGRGIRFGGDKASAHFRGRPMLARVLDALAECCTELVVVRAEDQSLPDLPGAPPFKLVHDEHQDQGPLAGLIAGFTAVEAGLVFATSADVPLLQPAVIRVLAAHAGAHDVALPEVGGIPQPLVAVYRRRPALDAFRHSFDEGNRRVVAACEGLRVCRVDEAKLRPVDPTLLSFRSANTPEELAELERLADS